MIMEEQRRTMEEMKEASAAIKDGLRKELKNMQISEENLRRALTQAELNRAEGVLKYFTLDSGVWFSEFKLFHNMRFIME